MKGIVSKALGPAILGFATRKGLDIHAFSVVLTLEKIEAVTSPSC